MSVIRRFFAAVLLLGIVVGAPIALWVFGRNLLPSHVPSWNEVKSFFTERDTGQLFLGALVIIGIIAWLVFTVSVLVEATSMLAGRRGQWRIPGLHLPQRAAGALLVTLFSATLAVGTALPASASAPPAAPLAAVVQPYQYASTSAPVRPFSTPTSPTVTAARPATSATAKPSASTAPQGPALTVGRYDTWWRVAERTLGDGFRLPEIVALNVGITQPDGGVVESADTPLRPGWVLRLPGDAHLSSNDTAAHPPAASAAAAKTTSAAPAPAVTVQARPGDTVSAIAERVTGNGDLWPEVAKASGLSNPDDLEVGQTVVIPAALIRQADPRPGPVQGGGTVRIQPGDTLSGISVRYYGNPGHVPLLAAANHISNPDDIVAGATLLIPVLPGHPQATPTSTPSSTGKPPTAPPTTGPSQTKTTPGAGTTGPDSTPSTPQPSSTSPTPAPVTGTPGTPASATPAVNSGPPAAAAQTSAPSSPPLTAGQTPAGAAVATPSTTTAPATPSTSTTAERAASANAAAVPAQSQNMLALLGITAGAAGAIWAALVLARRRSNRGRRPGRKTSTPSLPEIRAEKTLRERAAAVDVGWLEMALRSIGSALAGVEDQVPDVLGATLSATGLELQLSIPAPAPAPFIADGATWQLPVGVELPITHVTAADQMSPLPTLTSVGSTPGGDTVFLDLERLGAVQLVGEPRACRSLMTHMTTELAHQSWSDGINVTLVGWGQRLRALNPERIGHAATVDTVLRGLRARIGDVSQALDDLDTDVVRARSRDIAGDSWTPEVLLIDASTTSTSELEELQKQLAALAGAGRIATAVVMSGGPQPATEATTIELSETGELRMPRVFGQAALRAAAMSDTDADLIIGLFAAADQVDNPIPASTVTEPWAVDMDESGALLPAVTMDEPVDLLATRREATAEQDGGNVELPAPPVMAKHANKDRLAAAVKADPILDADLAEWHAPDPIRPRIAILGPAEITAAGETPKRLGWFTEVCVYLALHRSGVPLDKFTRDLWPADGLPGEARPIAKATRNETVSKVRRWLGKEPQTGELYVPLSTDGSYRLVDRLLDVELLQRLRKRGDARMEAGDPAAVDDYEAALKLVRGQPLPEASSTCTGWGWLSNEDRREDLYAPAWVVDVAHRAVQAALAVNDLPRARWAADLGHAADPSSDVPLTDLVVIAAAAGDMATSLRRAWEVVWANDLTNAEELPEHTYSIISRVFPNGLMAVSR